MCVFWKNGADFSVYAEEVSYNTTIKISFTWEINSGDIAHCRTESNDDLLYTIIGRNILASKIQVEAFLNFEEMKNDERSNEQDIVEIKKFIEDHPDGISWKDYYEKDENEETTDGFPIKVEAVWKKDEENWVKAIEDWNREHGSENMSFFDIIKIEHEQFNIEVNGKAVNVNELMSMVNEHHGNILASNEDTHLYSEADYMFAT